MLKKQLMLNMKRTEVFRCLLLGMIWGVLIQQVKAEMAPSVNHPIMDAGTPYYQAKGMDMKSKEESSNHVNMNKARQFLAPCPSSPNCVSSLALDAKQYIKPLLFPYDSITKTKEVVKKIMLNMPRTKLISEQAATMHFLVKSKIFRFGDDVEFYFDEEHKLVHWRSASRVGRSDFGVNRKRLEYLREKIKKDAF